MNAPAATAPRALDRPFSRHAETRLAVRAAPGVLFDHLDDHLRLSAHMTKRSWMMLGSRMAIGVDRGAGRAVGSRIRLHGRIMGIRLELEEVVTERDVPRRKLWQTVGEPRLLVIGRYRMGFTIAPTLKGSELTVFIDYDRPARGIARRLGALFGRWYADWCTGRMARDAAARFGIAE